MLPTLPEGALLLLPATTPVTVRVAPLTESVSLCSTPELALDTVRRIFCVAVFVSAVAAGPAPLTVTVKVVVVYPP